MSLEIFISYRRRDTAGFAGRLYDNLKHKYGRDFILFDVEAEGTVEELRDWVKRVVPNSGVALVLIGDQWVVDNQGNRRLSEIRDIVRLEIELALKHKIPIVPVLVDDAIFPRQDDLPKSIQKIVNYKWYELNNSFWDSKLDVLIEAIESVIKNHLPIVEF